MKSWLIRNDPDDWKNWRQEEKGTTEDEVVGWHHWLGGHESESALGVGDGHGSLAYSSPWGCQDSDMTEQLNWTEELKGCSQGRCDSSEITEVPWEVEPPAKKLLRTSDLLVVDFSSQTFWMDLVTVLGRYNQRAGYFTVCTKQYRAMETSLKPQKPVLNTGLPSICSVFIAFFLYM